MATQKHKRQAMLYKVLLGILALLLIILAFLFIGKRDEKETADISEESVTDATDDAGIFPVSLEDSKLELEAVFQYDGINPDCDNQEGMDIAAITLANTSGEYLKEALITVVKEDESKLDFVVNDLPAGRKAIAFSTENAAITEDEVYTDVECEAEWESTENDKTDQIEVSVEGIEVTLTNNTGEDIPELEVYCRSPLNEEYFGGIAYCYKINDFSAGETTTVEAADCILGMAEVVRIAIK